MAKAKTGRYRVRGAEAQREGFEAGYLAGYLDGQASVDKYGNTSDETPAEAFAAYPTRQQRETT